MTRADCDTFELPGTRIRPSRVAFGGHPVGGHGWGAKRDDEAALAALITALESGITFYDTADVYGLGLSEVLHGRAFRSVPGSYDKVVVATKGGVAWDEAGRTRRDSSPAHLRNAVEASLGRLEVESIDLYYLHWPDGVTPLQDSLEALVGLRTEGKIRSIGLSNVSADDLADCAWADVAAVQVKGNLLEMDELVQSAEAARSIGAATICYASLADGLLTGAIGADQTFGGDDHRSRYPLFQPGVFDTVLGRVDVLREVAKDIGRTPAQVAVRWLLDTDLADSVLCGSAKSRHVVDNAGALGWRLPDAVVGDLAARMPVLTSPDFERWRSRYEPIVES